MAEQLEGRELRQFLLEGTRTAKIACVRSNGAPVVSPVWFILDGDDILFTTMNTSLKYKLMLREPRVSICVDDDKYPYGFAVLKGRASIHHMPVPELLQWSTKIARRYVPEHLAEKFGERNAVEEEALIRVECSKAFAFSGIAD